VRRTPLILIESKSKRIRWRRISAGTYEHISPAGVDYNINKSTDYGGIRWITQAEWPNGDDWSSSDNTLKDAKEAIAYHYDAHERFALEGK
jgi:hypothetical protein